MGDHFLNGTNLTYEQMVREKKLAKLSIFFSLIGMIIGLTFTILFTYTYNLYFVTFISFSSGNIILIIFSFVIIKCLCYIYSKVVLALSLTYVNAQFLRDVWQIWTNHLRYWIYIGLVLQPVFIMLFLVTMILGTNQKQSKLILYE